jgi:HlyD family secretion protein
MLRLLISLLFLGVLGLLGHGYYSQLFPKEHAYVTELVTRMDIIEKVAVSGFAEPIERRQVQPDIPQGAVVEEVYVDFNSVVTKDQPLARLSADESELQLERAKIGVTSARAAKSAAEAGLQSAISALGMARAKEESAVKAQNRLRSLDPTTVSSDNRTNADAAVKGSRAAVAAAESEIRRCEALISQADQGIENALKLFRLAELQVQKSVLKSPIDGFVINIDCHVGDIVGRPKLMLGEGSTAPFEIASPLDQMRAIVKLSEADYSRVRKGQAAVFTVEAYPNEKFTGAVEQIRNSFGGDRTAVTYPTVISFKNRKDENGEWMVRPRATVSADIQIREVKGVLAIPNAALLFAPTGKVSEEIPAIDEGEAIVWVRVDPKRISPRKIVKGITNGNVTQVIKGDIKEGDAVVIAEPVKPESGFQGLPIGG